MAEESPRAVTNRFTASEVLANIRKPVVYDDPAKDEACGECEPCVHETYVSDEPDTHCINCTCLFCIPGA